jgi:hypothetical protein
MSTAHDLMERLAAADPVAGDERLGPEQQREADALLERLLATPAEAPTRATRRRRRWPQLVAATGVVAVAVFAALSLLDSDEGPTPNVVGKAVAALTQKDVIYHAKAIADARAPEFPEGTPSLYLESWHTTSGRLHRRTYAVKDGRKGRAYDDFAGQRRPGRLGGPALRYDPYTNSILLSGFGRDLSVKGAPGIDPFNPGNGLRELQAEGRLHFAGRVQVDGRPAYRLASGTVSGEGGTRERSEIVVDAQTYLPREARVFARTRSGATRSVVWHYMTYEKLPLNDETEHLLALAPHPGAKCSRDARLPNPRGPLGFPNPCAR